MDSQILVTNIQRFSLHDGPGIRTTVFCKGCSLRCPWCSNPENLEPRPEEYRKDGRTGTYGRYMAWDEVYREVIKDRAFYGQRGQGEGLASMPGGVTFSGGEPLLQAPGLEPLWRRLKEESVHLCAETSLFAPEDRLRLAIEYLDLFYVDVKILEERLCGQILGGNLKEYLSNLELLFCSKKPVVFRVPVIGGYTDNAQNRERVVELICSYPPIKAELLKEHNLGREKYLSLGKHPLTLDSVTDEKLEGYRREIEQRARVPVQICKI